MVSEGRNHTNASYNVSDIPPDTPDTNGNDMYELQPTLHAEIVALRKLCEEHNGLPSLHDHTL